ncbi:UDP-N-acetylmuramate--L-alanine ligase [bacterium]|nr:UDP-N-acetylmuramate--L-alanine ligase [bacterium]
MSGIAEVLSNLGYQVSGSDLTRSTAVEHLESVGIKIFIGHAAANITNGSDQQTTSPTKTASVIVTSSAVSEDNIEVVTARQLGIPVIPRAQMLAELMRMKYGIAVAGSHGKTTTTSLIAWLVSGAAMNPTVIIGGKVQTAASGAIVGAGDFLIAEADESDGSFNLLRPAISIVTNIDAEHLGYYGSFAKLEEAFHQFMQAVPFYGLVVACGDDPVVRRIAAASGRRVITYGLSPNNQIHISDVEEIDNTMKFQVRSNETCHGEFLLPLPGMHMASNALAAIAVAIELGVPVDTIRALLKTFPGVTRRSECIAEVGKVLILDDYGHHPTEIRATLNAFRKGMLKARQQTYNEAKIITIFQPHRYSRTNELFSEFLSAFAASDIVLITDIYAAGETPLNDINSEALAKALDHNACQFVSDLNSAARVATNLVQPGDIVVTMGAGNVRSVGLAIAEHLKKINNDHEQESIQ